MQNKMPPRSPNTDARIAEDEAELSTLNRAL
jgi:hypothetical protein